MANWVPRTGRVNVDVAGTEEQLTTTVTLVREVTFVAPLANAGNVFIGNSVASAGTVSSTTGITLVPGQIMTITAPNFPGHGDERIDLSAFWFDAATNDDDIEFLYFIVG